MYVNSLFVHPSWHLIDQRWMDFTIYVSKSIPAPEICGCFSAIRIAKDHNIIAKSMPDKPFTLRCLMDLRQERENSNTKWKSQV